MACAVQLAYAAVAKRDLPVALKHYTQAIDLKASGKHFNAMLYSNRAWVHQSMWQYPLAVADSSRAILLDENFWRAYHLRYRAWLCMGVFSLAAEVSSVCFGFEHLGWRCCC